MPRLLATLAVLLALAAPAACNAPVPLDAAPEHVAGPSTADQGTFPPFVRGGGTGSASLPAFNVKLGFGAKGDGSTDDRTSIDNAMAAACAAGPGNEVFFPDGTYRVTRDASHTYELNVPCNNVILAGVRGRSVIVSQIGLPSTPVDVINLDTLSNVTIRDLSFEGSWGNAATQVTDDNLSLPASTIHVLSTTNFPSGSASITAVDTSGVQHAITCAGPQTATSFTNCSGSTGTLHLRDVIGYIDDHTGINHATQGDPSSMGIRIRAGTNIRIVNVDVTDVYGDCFWVGGSSTQYTGAISTNIYIEDSSCTTTARHGMTIGQVDGLEIVGFTAKYVFGVAVDSEPFGSFTRNVLIERGDFTPWWAAGDGTRTFDTALNINGGHVSDANPYNDASGIKLINNTMRSGISMGAVRNVLVEGNTIKLDWPTYSFPGIQISGFGDDVKILNNNVSLRTQKNVGVANSGIWLVPDAPLATYNAHNVLIQGNTVHVRNGAAGISVVQPGGSTTTFAGTASAIADTTLTDNGSPGWTTNQWQGFTVSVGTTQAVISSNTSSVLTLKGLGSGGFPAYAWQTWLGRPVATPAAGTYVIGDIMGFIDIDGNTVEGAGIDSAGNGFGVAGDGIYVQESSGSNRNGSRVRVRDNVIQNVGANALHIQTNTQPYTYLEVSGNKVTESRTVPVTTTGIWFDGAPNASTLILRDNAIPAAVTNYYTGLSSGYWIVNAGPPQEWAGFGTPLGHVVAPPGSTYHNVSGGAGVTTYEKESATDNTGWTALGPVTPSAPDWVSQLGYVGGNYDIVLPSSTTTLTDGNIYLSKVRVYSSGFSKVLFSAVTANEIGATNVYVGVYKPDGSQSASMATATIDAVASFASSGLPRIVQVTLTNPITGLNVGDDVYVAVLPVGTLNPHVVLRAANNTISNGLLTAAQGFRSAQIAGPASSLPGSVSLSGMTNVAQMIWAAVQ